ncbi:MAG: kelch repeat-containing protein [Bryobacteraceae bacterium]
MSNPRGTFRPKIAALAVLAAMALPASAQLMGKWEQIAPFPDPHEEMFGATANGKMYVFGGFIPFWKAAGVVFEYDPATNKWTQKKQMARPAHHLALTGYNGKVYIFGGFEPPPGTTPGWVPLNNAWEYDPANDSWKALAPMPTARGAAQAAEINGKIYVIGGGTLAPGAEKPYLDFQTPQNSLNLVEEYDPATNTWRKRASMPTPRNHVALGAVNGKIYVAGGRVGAPYISLGSDISLVEVYDPVKDSWVATLPQRMPTARSGVGFGVYAGRLLVAGGEWQDSVTQTAFRAFEAYDPATDTWQSMPSMAIARHGVASAVVGNRFYLVSGDVQSSGSGIAASTARADAFVFSTPAK